MPLSDEVRRALDDMGYEIPTPVQAAVWTPAADGRDVLVQARTGTGKTAAFGLPLVDSIVRHTKREVQALVLCPTRELALQVSRELAKLGTHRNVSTTAIYGGAGMQPQIDAIRSGTQIIVGTPGRVLDHLRRGTLKPGTIRALVLDESDEMLSMGFERELTAIIDRLPEQRQTLLFSATVPPDIERIARNKLKDPELVILSGDQVGALEIDHFIYWVHRDKVGALLRIIDVEAPESAIVFCNTRHETEQVAQALSNAGHAAAWLNGDLPQNEREKVMAATREGRLRFLVATDVAARGIDISHLTHVINYDFPRAAEAYVHRTGRTGRAGRTGTAVALVTPQDVGALYILRLTYKIRPLERQLPSMADVRTRDETDLVLELADAFVDNMRDESMMALARRVLTHDHATELVAGLLATHLEDNPALPQQATAKRKAPRTRKEATAPERRGERERPKRERPKRERPKRTRRKKSGDADKPASAPQAAPATEQQAPPAEAAPVAAAKVPAAEPVAAAPAADKTESADAKPVAEAAPAAKAEPVAKEVSAPEQASSQDAAPEEETAAKAAPASESSGKTRTRTRRTRRSKTRQTTTDAEQAAPEDAEQAPAEASDSKDKRARPEASGIELHVSVGRRHGARASALKEILAAGGLTKEQLLRVRVRERYSFIEVTHDAKASAIEILNDATLGEHKIKAGISSRSAEA